MRRSLAGHTIEVRLCSGIVFQERPLPLRTDLSRLTEDHFGSGGFARAPDSAAAQRGDLTHHPGNLLHRRPGAIAWNSFSQRGSAVRPVVNSQTADHSCQTEAKPQSQHPDELDDVLAGQVTPATGSRPPCRCGTPPT